MLKRDENQADRRPANSHLFLGEMIGPAGDVCLFFGLLDEILMQLSTLHLVAVWQCFPRGRQCPERTA